jgi:hypothetical protein
MNGCLDIPNRVTFKGLQKGGHTLKALMEGVPDILMQQGGVGEMGHMGDIQMVPIVSMPVTTE